MVTIDLNQFHLDQIYQQITAILTCVAVVIAAVLALDNAVDALAKLFGNKEIDTLCGKLAIWLNNLYNKVKPTASVPPVTSGTQTTAPTGATS